MTMVSSDTNLPDPVHLISLIPKMCSRYCFISLTICASLPGQENHTIAKTTARCAQYMSTLKIECKCKISRRLHKNLHITILSLFGGEIIFKALQPMWSRYLIVT